METEESAFELARQMVSVGKHAGRNMAAVVTDMDQPLGFAVGNALEVKEAISVLRGADVPDLRELCLVLGTNILVRSGLAETEEEARARLEKSIESGAALDKLAAMVRAQGGDPACCDDVSQLPQAKIIRDVPAVEGGYIRSMDTIRLGNTAQAMGAGRKQKTDPIDYSVGFVMHKRIGDELRPGEAVATVHASSEESAARAASEILACLTLSPTPVPR